MTDAARKRGVVYSIIALLLMVWAIWWSITSFDIGFLEKSWEVIARPEAPIHFRLLGVVTITMFGVVIFLCLRRGLKMWRAKEWDTGRRIVYGLELRLEAAVVAGLGVTVFFFVVGSLLG